MEPFMLTAVTLLAHQEGWRQPERAARPERLAAVRRRIAASLRTLAVRVEPVQACEPMRPLPAR